MYENESDILIAEPEEETEHSDSLFEETEENSKSLFEYREPPKEENRTIKKESDTFVNYKFNNLNKVYKKYDVVKTYVPKKQTKQKNSTEFDSFVKEQNSYVPERETFVIERQKEKPKLTLKPKAKAWLVSIMMIIMLLTGLSIYNAIHINNMNSQITETQTSINNVNEDIKQVVKNIHELTDDTEVKIVAEEMGLREISEENKVTVVLEEKNEIVDYESQTNFFDKICNFFRNLFGG